jgi:photosystem II stability/assembly factor-like uncharacterized protein
MQKGKSMKKSDLLKKIVITAVFPLIFGASFAEGCLTCSISTGNFSDFFIYKNVFNEEYYYAVTFEGRFILMESFGTCQTVQDTMLHQQGLNAIDGFQFPFDGFFAVGNSGKILSSTYINPDIFLNVNSGTNADLNDIALCNDAIGYIYVVGDSGTILKSTNYGSSFFSLNSGTTLDLNEVQIVECDFFNDVVRIAGDSLLTLYSTNGGNTWTQQYVYFPSSEPEGFRVDLQTIHFINNNTGWAAGDHYIFKTTNNGLNWAVRFKQTQSWDNATNSLYFYDQDSGIIVGNRGDIQYTTNGGNNWFYNFNTQNLTTKNLNKFTLLHGIAAALGDSGIVVHTDSITVGIKSAENYLPDEFSLFQNYPNPFNPVTNIEFTIPRASFVKLRVYDLLGREVQTLIDGDLKPGKYNADWNAVNYSSGVYFYTLETPDYISTKKMVLVK